MQEDIHIHGMGEKVHIQAAMGFADFLKRSLDTARPDDSHTYLLHVKGKDTGEVCMLASTGLCSVSAV